MVETSIIALGTKENRKRRGFADVQLESSVKGALAAIADIPPDFAIIDFNLGGESSEAVLRKPCGMTEIEGLLAVSDALQARLDPR